MRFQFQPMPVTIELETAGDDHIARCIQNGRGFYEESMLRYISSLQLPRGTAVDVGANIGNHAVYFGLFVASEVVCFEPDKELAEICERNLQRHGIKGWVHRLAVGAAAGKGTFFPAPSTNRGLGTAVAWEHVKPDLVPVNFTKLDNIDFSDDGDGRVTLIKVDVEGGELAVLQGAEQTIQKHRPHLFVEAQTHQRLVELRSWFAPRDYLAVSTHGSTPVWHFAPREVLG